MRYSIHQLDASTWELRASDGTSLGTFNDAAGRTGYDVAVLTLSQIMSENAQASRGGGGLLPEGFMSPALAVSEKLPGGRDFSQTAWSWRDPESTLVPMFIQTKNEGHDGADLAGFFTDLAMDGTTVTGRGRFYDTDAGTMARDVLLDGRPFGVSVDPSEAVDVELDFECSEYDDFGDCTDGEMTATFKAYEIAGATMHPLQGFDKAQVQLDANLSTSPAQPVRASLTIPTAPPRAWMTLPEPTFGAPFLDGMTGDDVLQEQIDMDRRSSTYGEVVGYACPLTIRDDGLVYGHLSYWGQCHTGNPWGAGVCASASPSDDGYAVFHASGAVKCADGTEVPTGRLVVGCEHSDEEFPEGVRDHLAHAGLGWANVRVADGEHGPWVCGVLDPNLTAQQVATLRSLSMSGEWVGELGGILSVNASGLPIQRAKIAASAFGRGAEFVIPQAALRASVNGGKVTKLVGANLVRSCPECQKRRLAASAGTITLPAEDFAELMATIRILDLRTRHLVEPAAESMLARLVSRT